MRVVFDTNILVLNFIGAPADELIDAALSGYSEEQLSFFYSEDTMSEYRKVLTGLVEDQPEFFYPDEVEDLLADFRRQGRLVHPAIALSTDDENACSHEPDNRFLECAISAEADYIITVNDDHFPAAYQLPDNKTIRTVTPGQFQRILFSD